MIGKFTGTSGMVGYKYRALLSHIDDPYGSSTGEKAISVYFNPADLKTIKSATKIARLTNWYHVTNDANGHYDDITIRQADVKCSFLDGYRELRKREQK